MQSYFSDIEKEKSFKLKGTIYMYKTSRQKEIKVFDINTYKEKCIHNIYKQRRLDILYIQSFFYYYINKM